MDRCPNCGSSVRQGAKFCTTCGFRLPVQAANEEAPAPARSPFDTTSTAGGNTSWPAAAVQSTQHSVDPKPESDTEAAEEPNSSFGGWPSYGSGLGQRS